MASYTNVPLSSYPIAIGVTTHQYQPYPGSPMQSQTAIADPAVAVEPLPKCTQCQVNNVKPGDDSCLSCLGEEEPQFEWDDILGITMTVNGVPANQYQVVSSGSNLLTISPGVMLQSGDVIHITYTTPFAGSSLTWSITTSSPIQISSFTINSS